MTEVWSGAVMVMLLAVGALAVGHSWGWAAGACYVLSWLMLLYVAWDSDEPGAP